MVEASKEPAAKAPVPMPKGNVGGDPIKVAKFKVSTGGASDNVEFKGKVFTRDGEFISSPSAEDLAAMDASPLLVVERFDANGNLINRFGGMVKTLKANPPAAPKEDKE